MARSKSVAPVVAAPVVVAATKIKAAYRHGAGVARVTNPVGDGYPANFARGFALYHDADIKAVRDLKIDADKAAFKAYLLKGK